MSVRSCGTCQLCCYLMPVADNYKTPFAVPLTKPALKKCQYQRHRKGCTIYDKRPISCRDWSCAWLTGDLPRNLSRPDRSGYVVDPVPDTITFKPDNEPESIDIPVIQVWIDPKRINPLGDLKLPEEFGLWIRQLADEGKGVLIRTGSREGYVMFRYKGHWIQGPGNLKPGPGQLKDAFSAYVR